MQKSEIGSRQIRCLSGNFETRENGGKEYIEGYFAVFNSAYEIAPGMTESIEKGAFTDSLADDVRCLTDHDTRLVLGRTSAGTFEILETDRGLWGRVLINPKDQDAVNTKARVARRDVTQASIGFDILDQETKIREDGSIHWIIKKVKLYECSVCTFPAYAETNIQARKSEAEEARKKATEKTRFHAAETWRNRMRDKLKKGKDSFR